MFIKRIIEKSIITAAKKLPVIALVGPRQSGKTTLAQKIFSSHTYVSLEGIENRRLAQQDPLNFILSRQSKQGIILDEIQNVPELLSEVQGLADAEKKTGRFVISGSQNILLNASISQTLAGRVAIFTVLPLTSDELAQTDLLPASLNTLLFKGLYPRVYAHKVSPHLVYPDYVQTYLERDVRTLANIGNLRTFHTFIQLCAGRIGQQLNFTSLANECGITAPTAAAWFSVLEASYIAFCLQPYSKNFNKRLVKTPKLYFYDTGLACHLLGIENAQSLTHHYARGALFESFIMAELFKMSYNAKKTPHLFFWRDKTGHEVDCIIEKGMKPYALEIKSSSSFNTSFTDGLFHWNKISNTPPDSTYIVYGGLQNQKIGYGTLVSWNSLSTLQHLL